MLPSQAKIDTQTSLRPCLRDAFIWSSERWSKASGRTTVGLDQVRATSVSISTLLEYVRRRAKPANIYAFGYLNYQDHRLVCHFARREPHPATGRTLADEEVRFLYHHFLPRHHGAPKSMLHFSLGRVARDKGTRARSASVSTQLHAVLPKYRVHSLRQSAAAWPVHPNTSRAAWGRAVGC